MATTLQGADLLLINRGTQTYKGTMTLVAEFVKEEISGGSDLVLNTLADVDTGTDGPIVADDGKFLLCNATGIYTPVEFQSSVEGLIQNWILNNPIPGGGAASAVFDQSADVVGLLDVDQSVKSYAKTFLLGQDYAGASPQESKFKAVDFTTEVETVITNYFGTSGPGTLVEELNDLTDVNYTGGIEEGDILVWVPDGNDDGSDGAFQEANLVELVEGIVTDPSFPEVSPESLPVAEYIADVSKLPEGLGIIGVAKRAGTPNDPQILTLTNGVLDYDAPSIPDVFHFQGNFEYDDLEKTAIDDGGSGPSAPEYPASSTLGDIWVALVKDGTDYPGSTLSGNSPDPDEHTTIQWLDYDGDKIDVQNGTLVVCVTAGIGPAARWATMGRLDYTPVDPNLQIVLNEGNTATGKDILLTNGSVGLTVGSFTTTQGNVTTDKGDITTAEGDIKTTTGDIAIGARGVVAAGAGDVLSVPNIDFD